VAGWQIDNNKRYIMKGVISSKDLDRGEALTGVARQEAEARQRQLEKIAAYEQQEKELEEAIAAELEKKRSVKSKRSNNVKKSKK
tara:strand:- start:583 stop:837 length:255 start_codon:yes stop_codon:yes gene_type:complete